MSESDLITVKELAAELEITDLVLKKLLKFFELPNIKVKRNIHLTDDVVAIVRRVMALKAEGKRNKDIKQLFDDERKKEKKALEENKKSEKTDSSDAAQASLDITEDNTDTSVEEPDSFSSDQADGSLISSEHLSEETVKAKKEPSYIQDFIESEEIEAKFDVEQHDVQAEALALDALAEEEGRDLDEVELTEETEETTKDSLRPRKIRHKAFSFRYIQREIANDTKSLNFLKNKLKKGKLTHVERLNLLDSLDRRAKMLNSWIQILRWVKS
ncbi:MAG: MerR family transcriptional regulator [bacterium]